MVQQLRVPSTADDEMIQKRLRELYSTKEEERREKAQGQLLGQMNEESYANMCIMGSSVKLDRAFRDSLLQQVSVDENYTKIVQQL